MGLSDSEIALIVVAAVVGAALLTLAVFYVVFQRLPYFVSNLLRLPPMLSCQGMDGKHQAPTFDHTRVSGRLFCVSILPQLVLIGLLVLSFYEDADPLPGSTWKTITTVASCAHELADEQVYAAAVVGTHNMQDRVSMQFVVEWRNLIARTDRECAKVPSKFRSSFTTSLRAARNATLRDDVVGVAREYPLAFDQLHSWVLEVSLDVLDAGETTQLAELSGFATASAVEVECSSFVAAALTTIDNGPQSAQLIAPGEYIAVRGADSTFRTMGRMYEQLTATVKPEVYGAVREYLADPMFVKLRELTSNSIRLTHADPLSLEERRAAASNQTKLLDGIYKEFVEYTLPELKDSYEELEGRHNRLIGLPSFGIAITFASICINAFFIYNHRRNMQGSITIRKDFEAAVNNKQRFSEYLLNFERLEVERFAETPTNLSQVEAVFWALGSVLLHLKPFLSHALFEGDLDEQGDEDEEENFRFAGGRTSQYPIKFEVGMHFAHCSVMVVCAEMFNDLSKQWLTDSRDSVASDFNEFIRIVTEAASFNGGVVHHVGGGSVVCTWNTSLACDRTAERAVDAAFKLDDDFSESSDADQSHFRFIPDDEQLQIAVCSGDVMAGIVKTFNSKRHLLIGPCPLLAERLVHMCPFHCVAVLIDQETQKRVAERCYTKPVYHINTKEGEQIVYEIQEHTKQLHDDRMHDYREAFNLYRRDKKDEAIEAFERYLANIRAEKYGRSAEDKRQDRSAKVILERMRLERRRQEERARREANSTIGMAGALI